MDVESIRASGTVRAFGVGAMAIGAGLFVLVGFGGWPFTLPGVAMVIYGARRFRIAAFADEWGVVVRNQFRTHRLPWASIAEMGFYERDVSTMQWSMRSRSCGLLCTTAGRHVWVEATEAASIVIYGNRVTPPSHDGPSQLDRLHRCWARAAHAAPSA
jgi:Bacterial PH domain